MMNVILLVMRCCQSGDVAFKNCDDYRVVLEHLRDLTQLRCILPHFVSTTQHKADGYTEALDKSGYFKWFSLAFH